MKNKNLKKNLALLATVLLLGVGCSKDDSNNDSNSQEISIADVKTVLEADNAAKVVDNILTETYLKKDNIQKAGINKMADCYEGTFTDAGFTLTFDNCSESGKVLNGTINVVYTSDEGSVSYSASYDLSVNGIEIIGTRSFILNGNEDENSYSFTIISDLVITFEDNSVIEINGNRNFEFTLGDTFATSIYTISGNWSIKLDGNIYSVSVIDNLEGNLVCPHITTGSMQLSKNGLTVVVNFGDGTCDATATLVYPNAATEEISLND